MSLRGHHPTVALVASGLIIALALVPLYLGQLDRFRVLISNGARLVGLAVVVLAFVFGSWSILNHSGRHMAAGDADEPGATEIAALCAG